MIKRLPRNHRRGLSVVYATVAMTALCMIVSLAVDLGRVQLVKSELLQAADAAARAGAANLSTSNSAAQTAAINTAAANTADGSSVVITNADVECGTWDSTSNTFSVGGSSPNAVRVTARRTAANGNAVPLLFAKVLGQNTCNVTAQSVAQMSSTTTSYGFVGLSAINLSGSGGTMDITQYDSSTGVFSGKPLLATNGSYSLSGTIYANADLKYGSGGAAWISSPVNHTGTKSALASSLSYPNATANGADTSNSNASIPAAVSSGGAMPSINKSSSGTTSFTGGTYYLNQINMSAGIIKFTGAATLVINGGINLSGSRFMTYNNIPANLKIVMIGSSGLNISSPTGDMYMDVYAPQANLNYTSYWDIYGRAIMGGINGTGCGCLIYDKSLGSSGGTGTISLVR